ncbi:hypothetical protein DXG03_006209 [Asterophora parasitica]|uniref:Uncharacterized protein n=1 Tax=Asterophora parasitica TaxID=117018 RepID=A0A9P7KDP3_9AGAR|nr:hypothetical protein DXG03_006209 [Asterophora parasitica]
MSAAASQLRLSSPTPEEPVLTDEVEQAENEALEKLLTVSPPTSTGPVIAIDLDDVLSQTNQIVAEWHNEQFGTKMDVSMFYYYYYWKNPFWGTPKETADKITDFYKTNLIYETKVVPGAREGVLALRKMGFRLIIVTARTEDNADESWQWVNKYFPDVFSSIICTGQFNDAHKAGHEVVTKLSKAQVGRAQSGPMERPIERVCADLGAKLLIDDSAENALQCATFKHATPVLLFGDYEWNKRISGSAEAKDDMSFDRRLEAEGGREFWKFESVDIPEDAPLHRVQDWSAVVRWVQNAKSEGRL